MSSLGDRVVSIARQEVGYIEGYNNDNKYGLYFGANNQAWCAYFIMWCYAKAGYDVRQNGLGAGCSSWLSASNVSVDALQPGDVLVFVFNAGYTAQHVEIFVSYRDDGRLNCIGGNTGSENQSEGDGVHQKPRLRSNVVGCVRLSGSTNTSNKGYVDSNKGGALSQEEFDKTSSEGASSTPSKPSGSSSYSKYPRPSRPKIEFKSTSTQQVVPQVRYQQVSTDVESDTIENVNTTGLQRTKATSLLSYPTLVESPFIILKIGDYTFGSYTAQGSFERQNAKSKVRYPDYMTGINITKVNGSVNQYVISMVYQITPGDDPNRLDRIFSSVGYGTIYITYGDWAAPTFVYKEEEAIITKLSSNVDFASSRITYTLYCTSNAVNLMGTSSNYPARHAKPSDLIFELLYTNKNSGLLDVFYGMKNKQAVIARNLIPTNDKAVDIPAKEDMDTLSYINFLVTYMSSNTNTGKGPIKDSSYYLSIVDDTYGELGGPYFQITQVKSSTGTFNSVDTYEVDIGYPGENLVTRFQLVDDQSWALLYNYSSNVHEQDYVYRLDNDGYMITEYSKNLSTSNKYHTTTEAQRSWWTDMTQFPVRAEMEIKGLVRPTMLMTYVRVNAFFYGQRHVSSGLYIITKQQDKIDSTGYRTILSLTRIAGDEDYITRKIQHVVSNVPIITTTEVTGTSPSYNLNIRAFGAGDVNTSSSLSRNGRTSHNSGAKVSSNTRSSPNLNIKAFGASM